MRRSVLPLLTAFAVAGSAPAAPDNISAWFAPSASKIMRDARPGASPQEWELAAARNEVEACQLVLASERLVRDVTVTVSLPTGRKGKAALEASLFRVEYVPILKEKIPYPDPLPPLKGPFDLQPGQAQPVWISVRVPRDAAPGTYRGTVKVQAGSWKKKFPLRIKVWDFALPDTPACVTAFGNSADTVALWHDVKPGSPEAKALDRKYYGYLLDHRVSPLFIPADFMSDEVIPYLEDPRMTSYMMPYAGKSDEELKALAQRLTDGGWFSKGFFYVVDEPVKKEAHDALTAAAERLRRIEPRYRLVVPFWGNPDFDDGLRTRDLMIGKVNIWCPHLNYVDSEPGIREFLKGRANAGESYWWYVCNNPREPLNNLQIDQNAMAHRVLLWQQKREGIQGLLYWHTTYWDRKFIEDPWQNMDTLGDEHYGDGSLLYPGNKVGIDGPVGSLRLEVLRDSLEDFDYLTLADRLLGPKTTTGYIVRIARNSKDYERDAMTLETVRRDLGDALEAAAVQARQRR